MIARNAHHSPPYEGGAGGGAFWGFMGLLVFIAVLYR